MSVPPGTYEHGIVVVFKKEDDGAGSGLLEIQKPDGTWGIAWSECYGGIDSGATCVSVNETKTIKYRLSTSGGESSEKEAAYVITPKTANLSINGAGYNEAQTDCAVSLSDNKLSARIKLTNASALGAEKVVYVFAEVATTSLNTEVVVSDSNQSGIVFKGTGDDEPYSASGGLYPGRNSSSTNDKCTLKLTEFKAGEAAAGSIECKLSLGEFSDPSPLGKAITISRGAWRCDAWKSSLL